MANVIACRSAASKSPGPGTDGALSLLEQQRQHQQRQQEQQQSLSAMERGNPPPRQKSCDACIKAKRRCTLEFPYCQRCAQRKLACKYKRRVPAPAALSPATSGLASAALPAQTPFPGSPWNPALAGSTGSSPMPSRHLLPEDALMPLDNSPLLDFAFEYDGDALADNAAVPDLEEFHNAASSFGSLGPKPTEQTALTFPVNNKLYEEAISVAISTRLRFAIDHIRAAPRQMVVENQTPWCHHSLYAHRMPASMEDAYACCALFMAKNEVNEDVIFRHIEGRVQQLVSSPMPEDKLDILARTHALLLYQIMRLLEGGLRARSAESTIQPLEDAAFALMSHVSFAEGTFDELGVTLEPAPRADMLPALYPLNSVRDFWQNWVFHESARRTFLATFFFLQAYRLLKREFPLFCDGKILLCHSFTVSAHLWKARDHFEFKNAWQNKKHYVVKNAKYADDVDLFGKMLITTIYGIVETKTWLIGLGSDL
ncbi:hypothetical protein B0T24DRAFT_568259 [Lasiosphaeria ovina]|uniref:Zn(2)-C6 fungal-type domain-containing protein n=1 Tax=Lasiosphaeria ovina TaxID=92902 RepID=A0AAE0NCV2_9PEZI|nr:hypothetical protein B0T24DRAFT_568259 [Lasiosphaeria ovina]